jgi:transposase
MDKHTYRIQYLLDNDLNLSEAARHFGLSTSTLCDSLKTIKNKDFILYNKVKSHLVNNRIKKSKYYNIAMYIINNYTTKEKAARHFNVSLDYVNYAIYYYVKRKSLPLFNQIMNVLNFIHENDTRYMQVARYIISQKCSRKEVAEKFNIKTNSINTHLKNIKNKDINLYNQVIDILNQNKDQRYILIAKYLIETGVTYKEASKHFNVSEETISTNIHFLLKKYNPELYEKLNFI